MLDDVLLNKVATVERCLARVRDEYRGHEAELETNLTRQDAIVLNLRRACEACIDLAMHWCASGTLACRRRAGRRSFCWKRRGSSIANSRCECRRGCSSLVGLVAESLRNINLM